MALSDDVYDLEKKVVNLEKEKEELQTKLEEELMKRETNSLDDEYKFQFFNQYKDKFTPWELETLLKNGKQFLNENPLHI